MTVPVGNGALLGLGLGRKSDAATVMFVENGGIRGFKHFLQQGKLTHREIVPPFAVRV